LHLSYLLHFNKDFSHPCNYSHFIKPRNTSH